MKTNEAARCPSCQSQLSGATDLEHALADVVGATPASPSDGDATICAYCGVWLIFRADLTVRYPTSKESVELALQLRRIHR